MYAEAPSATRPYDLATLIMLALVGIVTGLFGSGCSREPVSPVDTSLARLSLETVLESWKKGETIETLKERNPSIVAQDVDWEAGRKLVGFEIKSDGRNEAVNLRIPVDLTLREKAGKEVKKKVKYVIGTSPVITVFREIF